MEISFKFIIENRQKVTFLLSQILYYKSTTSSQFYSGNYNEICRSKYGSIYGG